MSAFKTASLLTAISSALVSGPFQALSGPFSGPFRPFLRPFSRKALIDVFIVIKAFSYKQPGDEVVACFVCPTLA